MIYLHYSLPITPSPSLPLLPPYYPVYAYIGVYIRVNTIHIGIAVMTVRVLRMKINIMHYFYILICINVVLQSTDATNRMKKSQITCV